MAAKDISPTSSRDFWLRFVMAGIGITISMVGTCFITLSGTGPPPVSSPVWVATLMGGLSFGGWTFVINMLFIAAQLALLRSQFPRVGWLQIPAVLLAGASLDIGMYVFGWAASERYVLNLVLLFCGILVLGFGISLVATSDVIYLPGEGVVAAIAKVTNRPFHSVKLFFDASCVITACAMSFLAFGKLDGVREGTIISAMLLGPTVRMFVPVAKQVLHLAGRG